MQSGALASLAATLGSHREISRLRFCFEHVTFESTQAPYSPGDDPWQIVPASREVESRITNALAGHPFVPSRFEGLIGVYHQSLATGARLPVTLTDARARSNSSPRSTIRRRSARSSPYRSSATIRGTMAGENRGNNKFPEPDRQI
jgi:hypothetical protein